MSQRLKVITATPTLDTSAYSSGDRMGSIVTLPKLTNGYAEQLKLISINVIDKAKQNAAFDVLLFNASPTVASADNAAIDISDTEMEKLLGVVPIATSDYTTAYAGASQATKMNVNLIIQSTASSDQLYLLLVSRGAPTYAASDLIIKLGFEIY